MELLRRHPYSKSKIQYEIVCPECSADVTYIDSPDDISELDECECDICGETFEPTLSDLWVNLLDKGD